MGALATSADRKENCSLGNAEKEMAEFAPGSNVTVNMSEATTHAKLLVCPELVWLVLS